jgi:hypothetical protein
MSIIGEAGWLRVQDFIFGRELAEVYLLLDYLSGRSDKSLTTAIAGEDKKDPSSGSKWIEEICKICWPPEGSSTEKDKQAATLLLAKDRLNTAAYPANGASIVFTLMVAGDDEAFPDHSYRSHRRGSRLSGLFSGRSADSRRPSEANDPPIRVGSGGPINPTYPSTPGSAPTAGNGGGGGNGNDGRDSGSGGLFGGSAPSRIALARLAYPGLIAGANRFRRRIAQLLFLLFCCLLVTCLLSWHISAGRALLAPLDAVEVAKTTIQKQIDEAETGPPAAAESKASTRASAKHPVQGYCDQASRVPPAAGVKVDQFVDATQRQACVKFNENKTAYSNAREDVADWVAPWDWVKWVAHWMCGGPRCLTDGAVALAADKLDQQQWASVVLDVLATSVLPLLYGFLGAGAAVVRGIWGKMRESLLSPRDLTLSLGQLALGAIIGACIGLFITPSGTGSQNFAALSSAGALTPSALSFIAGFGVEGVFVVLEGLIKRLFNIPDPKA